MTLAIQELLASQPPPPEAIDRFMAEHSFPIVEGSSLTFVSFLASRLASARTDLS